MDNLGGIEMGELVVNGKGGNGRNDGGVAMVKDFMFVVNVVWKCNQRRTALDNRS